jgi:hypothetical protein
MVIGANSVTGGARGCAVTRAAIDATAIAEGKMIDRKMDMKPREEEERRRARETR